MLKLQEQVFKYDLCNMREGVQHGNHETCDNQQEDHHIQNFSLSRRLQGKKKALKFFIFCLLLCLLIWTTSKAFESRLPTHIERPMHQATTMVLSRGIIFDLFQYYRHPQAWNTTFITPIPKHQRQQDGLLDDDDLDSLGRQLLESLTHNKCDDHEHERQCIDEQGTEVDLSLEKDESLKNRRGRRRPKKEYHGPKEASPVHGNLGQWPLLGGTRETDLDIQAFYVKVPIGYGTNLKEYFMHIDTGSGISWVMCKGRGPITIVGPNGLFKPEKDNFLDCRNEELCSEFQEGIKYPCTKRRNFKCAFEHEYGDGLDVKGDVIEAEVNFKINDGSQSHVHVLFGCADKIDDEATKNNDHSTQLTDGLIGLGPHQASWLRQLNVMGLVTNYFIAICLEPGPSLQESTGFLSFGNPFTSKAASTVWTANIPAPSTDGQTESMYTARLMAIKYRTSIIRLLNNSKRKKDSLQGVNMGFDSGSDLTYFTKEVHTKFVQILDNEAKSKGYSSAKDSDEFVRREQRKCWSKKGQIIPVTDFGDLILMFASLRGDGTTSNLVIKPQYYITSGGSKSRQRTCLNMLKESDFDYGNIGAEVMKGHLFLFNSDLNQIGWCPTNSCKSLR